MSIDDVLRRARERLAAIAAERAALDTEEAKLRRMLAARRLLPTPAPAPWPWPVIAPTLPPPFTPWQPAMPSAQPGHGGNCACPECAPGIICVGTMSAPGHGQRYTVS